MAINSSFSFLVIFAFLVGSSVFDASIAFGGRKTLLVEAEALGVKDVFLPVDPNDPKVVELAKFAIDEYKKLKRVVVTYKRVLFAGSTSNQQGITYQLTIEATDATGLGDYDAKVLVAKNGSRKLISIGKKH